MDTLFKDLVYAGRGLRKNLGFATIATMTLALGIGACTAIFSVVNAVLLRPLPYRDADRLVLVWGELRARSVKDVPAAAPDFRDLQLQATAAFEDMAALTPSVRTPMFDRSGEPEQIRVAGGTANLFRLLGARILAGRDFAAADEAPQPSGMLMGETAQAPERLPLTAIISHDFWQRRFGGDAGALGRVVDLGGVRAEIVGVLAPEFELLFPPRANIDRAPEMWTAMRINYETASRTSINLRLIGRLKPGVSLDQANVAVEQVAAELRRLFPIKQSAGLHFYAVRMHEDLVGAVRPAIAALMGAVLFVLLIACANVGNLLVVRASARTRELAVRAAVGATRLQLARHVLAESAVIAAAGTALGVLLARQGIQVLLLLGPKDLPRLDNVGLDLPTLGFAVFAGTGSALLCGLLPALRAAHGDLIDALRASGRATISGAARRARSMVIVTEVALSFILLVSAGLMLRTVSALGQSQPGYDPNHVLTFYLQPRLPFADQRAAFMTAVRQEVLALPGVAGVTAATPLPLDGAIINARWGTEAAVGDPSRYRQGDFRFVLPGYFEVMRTRVLAGRVFTEADNAPNQTQKQVVIDELVAAKAFPGRPAVGQRLLIRLNTPEAQWYDVIGVVEHQRHATLAADGPECLYIVDGHLGHGIAGRWAVRTDGDPARFAQAVRAAVARVDPRAPLGEVQPMSAFVDKAIAPVRFTATLIGIFAAAALVLASVGLYGVLSTIVGQRTAEIGTRMAFGASRASILHLVVGYGLRLSGAGLLVGLVASVAATRVLASLFVGADGIDAQTVAGVLVTFTLVSIGASWLPAYRASRMDPIVALREQ